MVHRGVGPRGDGAGRDRGVGRRLARLHQADAACAGLRGRRRRHDLQGAPARHRRSPAVHGLPLRRAGPVARRLPPRPLRRPDGRRADGRAYVRSMCHDIEDPTFDATAVATNPRPSAAGPPPAARCPAGATPALRMDGDDRRVPPGGDALRAAASSSSRAWPPRSSSTRSSRARVSRTTRAPCSPTSTSPPSPTPRSCGSPTRSACRCTCSRSASCAPCAERGDAAQVREIATKQLVGIAGVAAERLHRALGLTDDEAGAAPHARGAPPAQPGGLRAGDARRGLRAGDGRPGPRRRRLDRALRPGRHQAAAGDRPARSTRGSTSSSRAPTTTGRRAS